MFQLAGRCFLFLLGSGLIGCGLYFAARFQSHAAYSASVNSSSTIDTFHARGVVEPERDNTTVGSAVAGVVAEVLISPDQLGQSIAVGAPLFRVDDQTERARLK